MGMIDLAKSVHVKLLNKLTPQRVVFHHVPKCGGTSVGRALRKRYLLSQSTVTPESSYRAFEAFTGRSDRQKMLVDVLDLREQMMLHQLFEDVRCVSLHVRFSDVAYSRFSDNYKFITVMRDPVSRFISHYYWSYGKPHAHARIEEGFDEFLETEHARRLGATYVEFYSGLSKDSDMRSEAAINQAIKNLHSFSAVGRLDDLSDFEMQLRKELGVKISIGHENKRTKIKKELELTPEQVEKVNALCAPDIAVWEGYFNE
jgi:hypothetical protein